MNVICLGGLASLAAGLATGLGAIPVFFIKNASPKLLDGLLGFSAGIMLGATSFSLVLPSIQLGGVWIAALGIVLGGAFLGFANRLIPHLHTFSGPGQPPLQNTPSSLPLTDRITSLPSPPLLFVPLIATPIPLSPLL